MMRFPKPVLLIIREVESKDAPQAPNFSPEAYQRVLGEALKTFWMKRRNGWDGARHRLRYCKDIDRASLAATMNAVFRTQSIGRFNH